MFRGRFNHNIDAKGRLNFASKFREVLSSDFEDKLILVKYHKCIRAYPLSEWKKIEKDRGNLFMTEAQEKALRTVMSSLAECGFDKQGRILIPQHLREYAGLTKEVVLVGMFKRIEIWDRQRLEEQEAEVLDAQDLGETLTQLGL